MIRRGFDVSERFCPRFRRAVHACIYAPYLYLLQSPRAGKPPWLLYPEGSDALRIAFKAEVKKRGLGPLVRANMAGCLDQCELGPTVVIYPQQIWYGGVQPADVPRIIDETIIGGRVLEDLVIPVEKLNATKLS